MMSLTNEDKRYIVSKKIVLYAIKDLVLIITIKKYHKVKKHCHYHGKHRGAAHNINNLRYKMPKKNFCNIS